MYREVSIAFSGSPLKRQRLEMAVATFTGQIGLGLRAWYGMGTASRGQKEL
ncbi:MAG: hypothetical protein OEV76_08595 [Anaerolineae bacterium]|nr:hypothetical protein [Anaerolineae bacterium]